MEASQEYGDRGLHLPRFARFPNMLVFFIVLWNGNGFTSFGISIQA